MPDLDTNVKVPKTQEREVLQANLELDEVTTQITAGVVRCEQTGDAPDVGEFTQFQDSQVNYPQNLGNYGNI